jgi:hypothetical protein
MPSELGIETEFHRGTEGDAMRNVKTLLAVTCLALFATTLAYGVDFLLKTNIPFPFIANGKVLPAGDYAFRYDFASRTVKVSGSSKGDIYVPSITSLAAGSHSTVRDAYIVFDQVGDTYTLSEVWEPNMDGVLLYATKGKHEHQVVHVRR